jgi:hypothetical protein
MPIIRRPQREVSLEPLRGGKRQYAATALSEGAGVEAARSDKLQQVGQQFDRLARIGINTYARIVEEERKAADETAALEFSNTLSAWRAKRIDGPDGAMSLKGESAFTLPEDTVAEFNTVADQASLKASTPEQQRAMARIRSQELQTLQLQVNRHVAREKEAYHAQVLDNHVNTQVNQAIGSYNDPKLVAVHMQNAVTAIENSAQRMGWGPEAIAEKTRAITSTTHLGVISNLIAEERVDEAATHFAAHKGEIDADKHDEVKRDLESTTTRKQSQKQADEIVAKGGTMTEQLEEVRRRFDSGQISAKVRDDTEARIRQHKNDVDEAKRDADRANGLKAYNIIDRLGRRASMDAIPTPLLESLDGSMRAGLRSYVENLRQGQRPVTNYTTYTKLWTDAAANPTQWANTTNMLAYRHQLSDADYEALVRLQFNIKTAPAKAGPELSGMGTRQNIIDESLATMGIDPNAKFGEEGMTAQAQLNRIVRQQVDYVQQTTGKEMTHTEIQALVDKVLLQKVTIKGHWWGAGWWGGVSPWDYEKKLIELTIDDVPPEDRAAIEQSLKGRHYNDQMILDRYFRKLMSEGGR